MAAEHYMHCESYDEAATAMLHDGNVHPTFDCCIAVAAFVFVLAIAVSAGVGKDGWCQY